MKTTNPAAPGSNPRAAGEAAHTPIYSIAEMRDGKAYLKRLNPSGTFTLVACFDADHVKQEERAFIVRACNAHAALVEALDNAERTLAALANSELTIDEDRNRTPLRLAQRADVWRCIDQARAALNAAKGVQS